MVSQAAASSSRSWETSRTVLRVAADHLLEPALGGHVEEVVGLVEQQDGGVGGEQEVEHEALALAARERRGVAVADRVEARPDDAPAGRVPLALELVAPEVRPAADRLPQRARPPPRRPAASSRSARSTASPASRTRAGATASSSSRTVPRAHADVLGHVERPGRRARRRPRLPAAHPRSRAGASTCRRRWCRSARRGGRPAAGTTRRRTACRRRGARRRGSRRRRGPRSADAIRPPTRRGRAWWLEPARRRLRWWAPAARPACRAAA